MKQEEQALHEAGDGVSFNGNAETFVFIKAAVPLPTNKAKPTTPSSRSGLDHDLLSTVAQPL